MNIFGRSKNEVRSGYGLEDLKQFLPVNHIKKVQVVGTNGKGSTCAFLCNVLMEHGSKVGVMTSPHIFDVCERIAINGQNIALEKLEELMVHFKNLGKQKGIDFIITDLLVLCGFKYFVDSNVDVMVLETGLGGRLDPVSCCNSETAIFTQIAMDHMGILGDTIEKIALEKVAIIKKNMNIISQPQDIHVENIIKDKCYKEKAILNYIYKDNYISTNDSSSDFLFYGNLMKITMLGEHQKLNAISALEYCKHEIHGFDIQKAYKAVEKTKVFGRQTYFFEKNILLDVCHNEKGIEALCNTLDGYSCKKTVILSIDNAKNFVEMIKKLKNFADEIVITQADSSCLSDKQISSAFPDDTFTIISDHKKAVEYGMEKANENNLVVFAGGFSMVAIANRKLNNK